MRVRTDEAKPSERQRTSARERGYTTACPIEKSGQDEFDFEYGEDFARHIEAIAPTFCKVLVRCNPEGDRPLNVRQARRLNRLSNYLHEKSESRFMFELLVPPEKEHLRLVDGDRKAYDLMLRPALTAWAIEELQQAGVEPDIWIIEGLDRRQDYERVVRAARKGGRDNVGCILPVRGQSGKKVCERLATACEVPGFIGFSVGLTSFWNALVDWRVKKVKRDRAVAEIARRYSEFVEIFAQRAHAA